MPNQPVETKEKFVKAQRFDLSEARKQSPKILAPTQPPADPIEHFRKVTCEKGHIDWEPQNVRYSIDHRSWVIFCNSCEEYYVIPAGSPIPIQLPVGAVPAP